jgi:hypothetical protein
VNITVNIQAVELAKAIEALASALSGKKGFEQITNQESVAAPAPVTQAPQQQVYTAPDQQQPAPTAVPTAPVQPPVQQPAAPVAPLQAVPTSAPSYTIDQLAVAATQLMDAGKRNELLQLLAAFGVPSLTALPKEQYGAFATKLREMGAQI